MRPSHARHPTPPARPDGHRSPASAGRLACRWAVRYIRHMSPPPGSGARPRRILVIANETCAARGVVDEVRYRAGAGAEVIVVAPALAQQPPGALADVRLASAASAEALQRLDESVRAFTRGRHARAAGALGDADPLQALDDALRVFDAGRDRSSRPTRPALQLARAPGGPQGARALPAADHPRGRRPRARGRRKRRRRHASAGRWSRPERPPAACLPRQRLRRGPGHPELRLPRPAGAGVGRRPGCGSATGPPADGRRRLGALRGRRPRGGRRRLRAGRRGPRAAGSCSRPSSSTATGPPSSRATGPSSPRQLLRVDRHGGRSRSGMAGSWVDGSAGVGGRVGEAPRSSRATSRPRVTRPKRGSSSAGPRRRR